MVRTEGLGAAIKTVLVEAVVAEAILITTGEGQGPPAEVEVEVEVAATGAEEVGNEEATNLLMTLVRVVVGTMLKGASRTMMITFPTEKGTMRHFQL